MARAAEEKFQKPNRTSVGGGSDNALSQAYRRQNHLTQNKHNFVREVPLGSVGKEGDIVYYKNPGKFNKVEQYIKRSGEWINLSVGRPISDSARVRKYIKAKAG